VDVTEDAEVARTQAGDGAGPFCPLIAAAVAASGADIDLTCSSACSWFLAEDTNRRSGVCAIVAVAALGLTQVGALK
jgi:hypothetical protein